MRRPRVALTLFAFVGAVLLSSKVARGDDDDPCGLFGECDYEDRDAVCCTLSGDQVSGSDLHGEPGGGPKRRRLLSETAVDDAVDAVDDDDDDDDVSQADHHRFGMLCNCANGTGETRPGWGYSMIVVSIFFLVGVLALLLFYFHRSMSRPREADGNAAASSSGSSRDDSDAAQRVDRAYRAAIAQSKAALVAATPASDDERCAICLDPMLCKAQDLARPPKCHHVYHRACLATWIDHVRLPKQQTARDMDLDGPVELTARAFACPMCGQTILPAQSDDKSDSSFIPEPDDDAPPGATTRVRDDDDDHHDDDDDDSGGGGGGTAERGLELVSGRSRFADDEAPPPRDEEAPPQPPSEAPAPPRRVEPLDDHVADDDDGIPV